jgi:hypothetical protein
MPYSGDVYSLPPGTEGTPNTTIESAKYNAFANDIKNAQNTPRPIIGGGTGASTAAAAFAALKQAATTTATGVVELATSAEAVTGTDTTRAVTPAGLQASIDTARPGNFLTSLTLTAGNDGAGSLPSVNLIRFSATPAANDYLAGVEFFGSDSDGNQQHYSSIAGYIISATGGAEAGGFLIGTEYAGTWAVRVQVGRGLFMAGATGGDQGTGTINATAVYDDGVQLITAASVAPTIAALSPGDVGTYLTLRQATPATRSMGYETTHSNLRLSDSDSGTGSTPPAGTYKLFGEILTGNAAASWLRIS